MADLTFTGERFLPACTGEIAYEHWHRYAFARRFVAGKRVLDAACGEGYGSALLGEAAVSVVGVDIDGPTIAHAGTRYGNGGRVRFIEGSCTELPLPDASIDVVVSFETIEHLREEDQPRMVAEFARVLSPAGIVVISSPNKRLYSDERNYVNEFHLHELYRDGLARLLTPAFSEQRWYHQSIATWSGIWSEDAAVDAEAWIGSADGVVPYTGRDGMYFVVVAARNIEALPLAAPFVSLLSDAEDSEGRRAANNVGEMLRLDALLKTSNSALDRQTGHILHLEVLVAERDRAIAALDQKMDDAAKLLADEKRQNEELNRQTEELNRRTANASELLADGKRRLAERDRIHDELQNEIERLNEAVNAKERVANYRQTFRWWLTLPWMRFKLWLEARRR
jgi:ubiquinone/menaquinone biosynthesis C-methylase UbiE